MSSYIESNLLHQENIYYQGWTSLWSLVPTVVLGLVLLPASGIGAVFLFSAAITYFSTELAVTNKRVVTKLGFIRRKTVELNIRNVESVQVKQGYIGRLFNFGTVIISGAGDQQAKIPGVSHPLTFKNSYYEVQESQA